MLVKKKLNEINKVGRFTQGFMDWKNIKKTAYQNLHDFQNLLIKLTVKDIVEKAWLLYYELPFTLNPGEKPNYLLYSLFTKFIIISIKYRRPVPSKFKEKLIGHFRDS